MSIKTKCASSLLAAGLLTVAAAANAAVGDTLTYQFDWPSTGGATASDSRATLTLTELAGGVSFDLTPNFSFGNRVDQLQFAYSGESFAVGSVGANNPESITTTTGHIDSGYSTSDVVVVRWPSSNANRFDSGTSQWTLLGDTLTLEDFQIFATSPSKPTPSFGVISMPGATPSNWVAGEGVVQAVPEPETYALMLLGLGAIGLASRRRASRR